MMVWDMVNDVPTKLTLVNDVPTKLTNNLMDKEEAMVLGVSFVHRGERLVSATT